MRTSIVVALIAAIIMALSWMGGEVDLAATQMPVLGTPGYDIKDIESPTATGTLLHVYNYVLTRTPVGTFIRRALLRKNQFQVFRYLAAQVPVEISSVFRPIKRISPEEHARHERAANVSGLESVIEKGFTNIKQTDGLYWSIEDYARAYREGKRTPTAVVKTIFAAASGPLAGLRIFTSIKEEQALAAAAASEERLRNNKPLSVFDGVPVAVKDEIDMIGHVTSDGMVKTEAFKEATRDDVIVQRLKALGAIVVGKTVMTEIGGSPLGFNSHYNATFNPYDERYFSGGSSSGSAVAVATGLVPMAVGFDGGGSIRIPSCLSGVFGISPTYSRVPFDETGAAFATVTHGGPIAATARDTALSYAVLAQNEPGHHFTRAYGGTGPPPPHLDGFDKIDDFSDQTIGIYWDHFRHGDADVVAQCEKAVKFFESKGAKVVSVQIPHMHWLSLSHSATIASEMSFAKDSYYWGGQPFEPALRIQLGLGNTITSVEYAAAARMKGWALDYISKLFKKVDVLISPTVATHTPRLDPSAYEAGALDVAKSVKVMRHIFLNNLIGNPGMSVPVGYQEGTGLPIGLHITADHWEDAKLLRYAHALEVGFTQRQRPSRNFVNVLG